VQGITPAIARDIVQWRNQRPFQSIGDLLNVTEQSANQGNGPTQNNTGTGSPVIDDTLLEQIGDDVTVGQNDSVAGLININTASPEVLQCLPNVDSALAHAIISYRESDGFYPNVAWLLKASGMTDEIFKGIAPMLTTRSETFRVVCEGRITSTGTRQRIQAILHVGPQEIQTLSYEENL
jgi:competence ComEA-like helix-hairpin-helix protein